MAPPLPLVLPPSSLAAHLVATYLPPSGAILDLPSGSSYPASELRPDRVFVHVDAALPNPPLPPEEQRRFYVPATAEAFLRLYGPSSAPLTPAGAQALLSSPLPASLAPHSSCFCPPPSPITRPLSSFPSAPSPSYLLSLPPPACLLSLSPCALLPSLLDFLLGRPLPFAIAPCCTNLLHKR